MKSTPGLWTGLLLGCAFFMHTGATAGEVKPSKAFNPIANKTRQHLDHSPFFKKRPVKSPQEATRACLNCHPKSGSEVMKTAHWTWLSGDAQRNGKTVLLGKRTQLNNFCISINGNWAGCTACHAGYGWTEAKFDFDRQENIDCLVCHDGSGTYVKGKGGLPRPGVDLNLVAGSVRTPFRDNCGSCHFSGGGGMGVKHGDLDDSLLNPSQDLDIHMGKLNFQCIDCHATKAHFIPGKINATYTEVTHAERFDCSKCHTEAPHKDADLNRHVARVACQTCHIPAFARKAPTKMQWDWSQAGKKGRDDPHEYLRIKGSFKYESNVTPEYGWYNGKMDRYVMGDPIVEGKETAINQPRGSRTDRSSKIWPFKVHKAKQVYDLKHRILLPPVTGGDGGYWTTFDWNSAVRKGAELAGLPYSGKYGFTPTRMYWPITHMAAPAKDALTCDQCHSEKGRLDWKALGYTGDPMEGK